MALTALSASGWIVGAVLLALTFGAAIAYRRRTLALEQRSRALEAEVTRREAAEAELRAQRSQFESVLEGAHDGIFAFDGTGRILYANPAMHWTFGAASSDLVGVPLKALAIQGLSRDDELESLISESGHRQRWKTIESSAQRISGEEFEVEISVASDVNSEDGCYVGIVRDISQRNRVLKRLRISEERYRRLFQTAPMAIMAWKPNLRMIEWNHHATDLFRWPAEGNQRSTPGSIPAGGLLGLMVGEASVTEMRDAIRSVLTQGGDSLVTVRTRISEFDVRNCRWHLAPLLRPSGKVWAFISLVIDMSEEDRVAEEFKLLRSHLARAEETERARIARELHDDLSQRIAAVALDLQLTENRVGGMGDRDLAQSFGELRLSVEAVASDVHSLSRQLHPTVLDDLGLIPALRSECARRAKRSDVEIVCEGKLEGGEPHGATGLALFRVVQEALQNALKHGRATRIAVALVESDSQIELTVEDNGSGFVMRRRTDGQASGGKGIGFASMRERMLLVGGDLRVSTLLGTGTVVRAVLPRPQDQKVPLGAGPAESLPKPE